MIIYVLLEVIQFSCKNGEATDFETIEHIHKDFCIVTVVVDEAGHDDKVELVFVFWFDLVVVLSYDHSLQVDVCVLTLGNLDQIITAIDPAHIVEPFSLQVASNKALPTAHF